ncbi:hypothetical protein IEQ34_011507 [Dendrobium chrysotoxum]|uniref:Uncharacterized protein n=1 Tax=Dendrobium chrysotoxum TaxID=161865 RepID=A0AAV7GSE1_DENCH|nr:hypothetical protein IEQ34_011507 [Dendrobium chrysotoxum]
MDCPMKFNDRRDLIVEKLCTSHLSLNNVDDEYLKKENTSSNHNNPDNNVQLVREVIRIKKDLSNNQLYESYSESDFTEIGRTVNALQKHNPNQIQKLVQKVLVDECV